MGKSGTESHCDFDFKHLNMSFIDNKLIVDLNSNCHDCSIQKTEEKLYGFRQTDMVEFLIDERKNCQWYDFLLPMTLFAEIGYLDY